MALLQFISGTTVDLLYDFFTTVGVATPVDNPQAKIYTPQHTEYANVSLSSVAGVTGEYHYLFLVPTGATIGHWSTIGVGYTNSSNLFTFVQPFSIVDFTEEPLFIGVQDLRDYLAIESTDHTKDELYKRILLTAVSLVEQYTRRKLTVHNISETIHVKHAPVIILKDYPVNTILGMTVSYDFSGAIPSAPNTSSITPDTSIDDFFFNLNKPNGIMDLVDDVGSECIYRELYVEIDYEAGYLQMPEAVRTAILMLASSIFNMSQSEGLDVVRFGDLQFAFSKGLFTPIIKDALVTLGRVSLK